MLDVVLELSLQRVPPKLRKPRHTRIILPRNTPIASQTVLQLWTQNISDAGSVRVRWNISPDVHHLHLWKGCSEIDERVVLLTGTISVRHIHADVLEDVHILFG